MERFADPKYFDYAASSPPWPESLDAYKEASITYYTNPSSLYRQGRVTKRELLTLKKTFCDLLHFYDGRLLLCTIRAFKGKYGPCHFTGWKAKFFAALK